MVFFLELGKDSLEELVVVVQKMEEVVEVVFQKLDIIVLVLEKVVEIDVMN